jgi:hypothetical protein
MEMGDPSRKTTIFAALPQSGFYDSLLGKFDLASTITQTSTELR